MFKDIDKVPFIAVVVFFAALFLFIVVSPETASSSMSALMEWALENLGWVYIVCYAFFLIIFLAIGLSGWGKIKLGKADDVPEFSTPTWVGLLFGAGVGVGLVFFGVTEPASFFTEPMYASPGTPQAASDAMRQSFFHWSFVPWAGYGLAGLCIAYFRYRKDMPGTVASTLWPLFGSRVFGALGKVINIFTIVAMVCGISMSLGYASTQFMAGVEIQYSLPSTIVATCLLVAGITIVAVASCASGLAKGIKHVSNLNLWLVVFLVGFGLVCGPTLYIMNAGVQATGNLIANLPWMIMFTDADGAISTKLGYNWVSSWTVFYWAWWCAFVPFVGGFLADISKGRTIRELVIASLVGPSVICCVWFAVFGGGAIESSLVGGTDVAARAAASQEASLFVYLQELPLAQIIIPVAMLLILTLIITSMNSAAHVISSTASKRFEPSGLTMTFWLVVVALFAALFMWLGGLSILRNAAVLLAFPFVIIMVLMAFALLKELSHAGADSPELGDAAQEEIQVQVPPPQG